QGALPGVLVELGVADQADAGTRGEDADEPQPAEGEAADVDAGELGVGVPGPGGVLEVVPERDVFQERGDLNLNIHRLAEDRCVAARVDVVAGGDPPARVELEGLDTVMVTVNGGDLGGLVDGAAEFRGPVEDDLVVDGAVGLEGRNPPPPL